MALLLEAVSANPGETPATGVAVGKLVPAMLCMSPMPAAGEAGGAGCAASVRHLLVKPTIADKPDAA